MDRQVNEAVKELLGDRTELAMKLKQCFSEPGVADATDLLDAELIELTGEDSCSNFPRWTLTLDGLVLLHLTFGGWWPMWYQCFRERN